jgi:hypothetical protein
VNELVSMLVPLETFSGWPQVPNPTPLQSLTLLIGIPLLIALIVIAMIEIGARARAKRGDIAEVSDPLWVGARESAQVEAVSDSPEGAQATAKPSVPDETAEGDGTGGQVASGEATVADQQIDGDDTGEHVGGAGARW